MKIQELHIEGFRSLKNVTWKPGDLNVVIGPNGSGKSNLLRMLELVSVAAQGRLSRHILASGGTGALVWDAQADKIWFHIEASGEGGELILFPASHDRLAYQIELLRVGKGSSYVIERELLHTYSGSEQNDPPHVHLERIRRAASYFTLDHELVEVPEESVTDEETSLPQVAGQFDIERVVASLRESLASWTIYHDVRVDQKAAVRQAAVTRYEARVDPDGQNLVPVLNTFYMSDRQFKEDINAAMSAAFGEEFQELVFVPDAAQRIQLAIRWKSLRRDTPAADLSDGTLRFLFLITVLGSPSPPPLVAIDEPETGLHPSMFPIIAEFARDASERAQVIFTTHSDQFLSAFRDVRPTTTVAKWGDGETTLQVVDDESLAYWLKDYSLGELYRTGELEQMD